MIIFVGNLHVNTSKGMLYHLFAEYGQVLAVAIAKDSNSCAQCYGYVNMKEQGARKAIKQLNKINFMNHFLNIHDSGRP